MSTTEIYSPGLEGVIGGETAISTIVDGLSYRGYPVTDLAEQATYDEIAYLLLHGDLPTASELDAFHKRVAESRSVPGPLLELFKGIPKSAAPMDVIRTAVSVLAHFDPETEDSSHAANVRKAERLLGQIPVAIAAAARIGKGLAPVPARADLGHASSFLYLLRGVEPDAETAHAFDVSLILYAEHEFNASTFTARVITSTESDLHAAIVGAIGALKGRLHGGANEKVVDLLRSAGKPDQAESWLRAALARKEKLMGFGHRVYKAGDVRAKILQDYARKAAEKAGYLELEETAAVIERILAAEKNLHPNLDWPAGRLYHALGLEVPLYTPIFVMSRVAGWAAHVIEQAGKNRLIRPRSRYIGPDRLTVRPLSERGK
jgi:citrate synthase